MGERPPDPLSLSAGQRLSPYVIVSPLGAGGMSEVYHARDTKVDQLYVVEGLR